MKYLLGIDIGSSSIKVALLDIASGKPITTASSPETEMQIFSTHADFAEQDPETWWNELVQAMQKLRNQISFTPKDLAAIGVAYQMHGLVCVDKNLQPLRPSIIWCDSRAVQIGNDAFHSLGEKYCLEHFLNSPGNFTASKLKWVKDNEPKLFEQIYKVMLPGDYIAMRLTGEPSTTISGLSEGILWDFKQASVADSLLQFYGVPENMLSTLVPTFGEQGKLLPGIAEQLGLAPGIPITYRAGDQPNNAFSLRALHPGEVAATAGTSGVIYGVSDQIAYDPLSRVNTFVHVNHTATEPRYGILLCVNGTGILNSWLRKNIFYGAPYEQINAEAALAPIGSDGLRCYPFGNGAERMLENISPGATFDKLQFNTHNRMHLARAAQEGIVFALHYGANIMQSLKMPVHTIRAGHANMFLSDVFAQSFANVSNAVVELYNTDGAVGAARAAGLGAKIYASEDECFNGMELVKTIEPDTKFSAAIAEAYADWTNNFSLLKS